MGCPWENPLFENTDQLMDERYIINTLIFIFLIVTAYRFSFLDLKEYSDIIDDDDESQMKMVNGMHVSVDHEDSGADTDSSGELLERIQPTITNVKTARRMSKDQ